MDSPSHLISLQFDALRKQYPHKIALLYGDTTWTYQSLFDLSMSYSTLFLQSGITQGHLVIVHMPRSPEWIACILGLIHIGAVYLALDPKLPEERKQIIRQKSRAPFMLSWSTSLSLPKIERLTQEEFFLSKEALYVMYTSGSSGHPKGVIGSHRSLKQRIEWMHATYPIHFSEVLCMKTPLSFVDHVAELFQALLHPTPLAILKDEDVQDIHRFLFCLKRDQITRLVIVPSLLKMILQLPSNSLRALPLRFIFSSGELLPHSLAEKCMEILPLTRLINIYGSTEVGADATYYEVKHTPDLLLEKKPVSTPIGFPLPGAKIWIFDDMMKDTSKGMVGQIYVGGECLALGYLHDEKATATHFIPHPTLSNTLLYATGDYGKQLPSGALEYVGRKDQQVKIRGCRVDLIEVEQKLLSIPSIDNVCTLVYSEELFAFYNSSNQEYPISEDLLRQTLQQSLPEYMIPSHYIFLRTLPLLPSGKVDRLSLAELLKERSQTTSEIIPLISTKTPLNLLIDLCRYLLKTERIDIDSNFFDIGFNSLSINNILIHLQQRNPLKLIDLYTYPTVRTLAAYLEAVPEAPSHPSLAMARRQQTLQTRKKQGHGPL